jgi:hypothetical protein
MSVGIQNPIEVNKRPTLFYPVSANKINLDAILELHTLMTVMHDFDNKAKGLNMDHWRFSGWNGETWVEATLENAFEHTCGTSACVVGFSVMVLKRWQKFLNFDEGYIATSEGSHCFSKIYERAGKILNIGKNNAQRLFDPSYVLDTYGTERPTYGDIALGLENLVNEAFTAAPAPVIGGQT